MSGIDGYSEQEFAQIYNKYEHVTIYKIIKEISEEYDIGLASLESVKSLLSVAISKGITEGMEIGLNRYRVYDVVGKYPKYQSPDTLFEEGLGICGILTPDGTFLKCNNAEHYKIVADI